MLLDKNAMLSDNQTISETAASSNIIDNGAAGNAAPGGLFVVLRTETAFAGATKIVVSLQTAADSAFTSPVELLSATYLAADLGSAKKTLLAAAVPAGMKRYLRAYYTVTGTVTAGSASCFLTDAVDMH